MNIFQFTKEVLLYKKKEYIGYLAIENDKAYLVPCGGADFAVPLESLATSWFDNPTYIGFALSVNRFNRVPKDLIYLSNEIDISISAEDYKHRVIKDNLLSQVVIKQAHIVKGACYIYICGMTKR